jgi:hypothetical protein
MATDNPLILSAIIGSKNVVVLITLFSTDHCLDIEVEGDVANGKRRTRSLCEGLYGRQGGCEIEKVRASLVGAQMGMECRQSNVGLRLINDLSVNIHLLESAGSSRRRR